MQVKLPIRQELFCQHVVSGLSATDAYIKAGYKTSKKAASANSIRLIGNDKIEERIAQLRAKTIEKLEMKRETVAKQLFDAIITPIGDLNDKHPLVQEVTTTTTALGVTKKVKMMGKVESARLLCDMMGWKEPEKHIIEDGPERIKSARERALEIGSPLDRSKDFIADPDGH